MQRQINNLARRWKRAKAKAAACRQRSFGTPGRMQRCRTNSPQCLMVYFLAGRSSAAAVDFVLGRGWACRSKRSKRVGCVAAVAFQDAEVVRQIQIGVEEAVGSAAPSAFVALQTDPLTHFEFSDLLSAHKYVLEWNLYHWIASQNATQGVAPSREQVCAQCPVQISVHAPAQIQEKLRKLAHGSARKQRKWLQRFRNRWGARLGGLRVQEHISPEQRREKVTSEFGAGQVCVWGSASFWVSLAGPNLGPSAGPLFGSGGFLFVAFFRGLPSLPSLLFGVRKRVRQVGPILGPLGRVMLRFSWGL